MFPKKFIINIVFIIKHIIPILLLSKEKKIAEYLVKNALKVSVAESCTGGLISSRLTDVSGSSAYIFQNFVTYANQAKEEILGVRQETIKKYGVVSEEVAAEMVQGLLSKNNCTIALATTGIAGPLGASYKKPVGLICIAIADKKRIKTITFNANPLLYRRVMKYIFSDKALELLLRFLKENY